MRMVFSPSFFSGPTLLEDFIMREKITHFDHERIPERIVHARGSAAHGYFQVYKSLANLTSAQFLQDPSKITPVFVRFSTVGGSRGSADTVRDVRGFATKFYTEEGNFDLVGNNIPVFFVQDAMKFPDFVHSVKVFFYGLMYTLCRWLLLNRNIKEKILNLIGKKIKKCIDRLIVRLIDWLAELTFGRLLFVWSID